MSASEFFFISYKNCPRSLDPCMLSSPGTLSVAVTPDPDPRIIPNQLLVFESSAHQYNELLTTSFEPEHDWTSFTTSSSRSSFSLLSSSLHPNGAASSFSSSGMQSPSSQSPLAIPTTPLSLRTQTDSEWEKAVVGKVVDIYDLSMTGVLLPVTIALNVLALLVFGGCHATICKGLQRCFDCFNSTVNKLYSVL